MEFQPGAVSLNDIVGGTLDVGVVPWPRFTEQEYTETNPGIINLLNVWTTLGEVDLANLVIGDRILMVGKCLATKGAVPGNINFRFHQPAGVAQLRWFGTHTAYEFHGLDVVALALDERHATVIAEVNGPGSATLRFDGRSIGSNAAVAIGDAEYYVVVFRGA